MSTRLNEVVSQAREARARRALAKDGYTLAKDRAKTWSINHQGGYRIINPSYNVIVAGENFDLELEDVEAWGSA